MPSTQSPQHPSPHTSATSLKMGSVFVGISLAYSAIALYCFPRAYATIDNPLILRDIQNDYPSEFVAPVLGKFLSMLYVHVSSEIAWFGVLLFGCLALSHSLTAWILHKLQIPTYLKGIILAVTMLLYTQFILRTGYNSACILLTGSALFALLTQVNTEDRIGWKQALILGGCIGLSYLIRHKGCLGVVVFFAPAIILSIRQHWFHQHRVWLSFFAIPILCISANSAYFDMGTDDEFKDYYHWNNVRGKFHQFPIEQIMQGNEEVLEKTGWSELNYSMLKGWLVFDENIHNNDTVGAVTNQPISFSKMLSTKWEVATQKAERNDFTRYQLVIPIIITLALMFSVLVPRKFGILLGVYILYFAAVALTLAWVMRFPNRIGYPFTYIGLLALVTMLQLNNSRILKLNTLRKISVCFLGALLLSSSMQLITKLSYESIEVRERMVDFDQTFEAFNAMGGDIDFAYISPSFPGMRWHYMDPLKVYNFEINVIPTWWCSYSPRFYDALNQAGIEKGSDLFPQMVDNPRAVLMSWSGQANQITQYLQETHNIKCELVSIGSLNKHEHIYRLESIKP